MDFKFYTTCILILYVTLGFEVNSVQSSPHARYLNSIEDERLVIGQFYNYVDIIMNIKLDNMLRRTQDFAERLFNSIPLGDRGNTAELLHQYRVNSQRLRDEGGSIQDKEGLLMELQQLIATIKSGLGKQEKDDNVVFELLARLSTEERKLNNKFFKAALVLLERFSEADIERHRELFTLLDEINAEVDIVQKEKLFGRFKTLRANQI